MLIKNIDYYFKNFHLQIPALELSQDINLICGDSGSGKSTLVDILVGFKKSKDFYWEYEGQNLSALSIQERKIGLVLQKGEVFPHLTGLQCIKFAADCRGVDSPQREKDTNYFLDTLNLSKDIITQKALTLSGGEKQRLAIICALIGNPRVLILDEPFSALDTTNKMSAFSLIKQFSVNRSVPVILVSHDREIQKKVQNKFELKSGKLVN